MLRTVSAIVLSCASLFAQQPAFQDPLLDHLAGNWILRGAIDGKQTTHDVAAEWMLGHQYLRIHEISREKDSRGLAEYEANVYVGFDRDLKQYECFWLDTYGSVSPAAIGTAKRSGDAIPFVFNGKDSLFHTTFEYMAATDSWEWRMDSEEKGALKPFARMKLTRR